MALPSAAIMNILDLHLYRFIVYVCLIDCICVVVLPSGLYSIFSTQPWGG